MIGKRSVDGQFTKHIQRNLQVLIDAQSEGLLSVLAAPQADDISTDHILIEICPPGQPEAQFSWARAA
jgi:hypothetical protein